MNLEKFTDRAKGFLQSAQTVAIRMNHQRITPEHVLKALLEDKEGMAAGLIQRAGGNAPVAVQEIDKALAKFAQKYQSALLHRNAAALSDLRRLKWLLHPSDQPQERVLSLPYFAARYGERTFMNAIAAAIDPWDSREKELRP